MKNDEDVEKINKILNNRHMSSCTGGYQTLAVKELQSLLASARREAKREVLDEIIMHYSLKSCLDLSIREELEYLTLKKDQLKSEVDNEKEK